MTEHYWLETCSRRLSELAGFKPRTEADEIAIRLSRRAHSAYRKMHPVAAAELVWQEMQFETKFCLAAAAANAKNSAVDKNR